jgi:putative nucleotidyltransferase with HDIG domain
VAVEWTAAARLPYNLWCSPSLRAFDSVSTGDQSQVLKDSVQAKGKKAQVWRTFVTLGLVAVFGVATVASFAAPSLSQPELIWVILPLLALLAEFMPVELSRRGVRVAFTLPFVVGVMFAKGPLFAIATDALVTLVAGYALIRRSRSKYSSLWLGINAFVGMVSTSVGALAMISLNRGLSIPSELQFLGSIAFMVGYGTVNFSLVTFLDSHASGRPWSENLSSTFRLAIRSFAIYTVVGMAVATLVVNNQYAYIPLTLVPVMALRTALQYQARMYEHYYETITALTLMLQRSHPYTHGHLERVAKAAEEVARRLGLSSARSRLVREAAVLHDIGKIAVDEALLDKPAKLTESEMDHVRKHAEWGAEILRPVRGFKEIIPWILHHHERPDGTGYPARLQNDQIPLESKIIAVVDAYDAMTGSEIPGAKRTYRDPMSVEEALAELSRCSNTQFDPQVVTAFRAVVLEGRF